MKKILFFIVIISSAIILAGCGTQKDSAADGQMSGSANNQELNVIENPGGQMELHEGVESTTPEAEDLSVIDNDVVASTEEGEEGTMDFELDAPKEQSKIFDISAENFSFSMDEIRVKKGDTVQINLLSADGFHDWVVDEFGAAAERVNTGQKSIVIFTADKAGEFEYYCSVGNHRAMGMKGKLIVE